MQLREGLFYNEHSNLLNLRSQFMLDDKMLKVIKQDPKERIFNQDADMREFFLSLQPLVKVDYTYLYSIDMVNSLCNSPLFPRINDILHKTKKYELVE